MRLRFTPTALAELDNVLGDIALHSPQGATRVRARIRAIIELLLEHPNAGQRTNVALLRRIVATPSPYLVFYEVRDDQIVVIGVRHAARDPRSMPGG